MVLSNVVNIYYIPDASSAGKGLCMEFEVVDVNEYSGYKSAERPRDFTFRGVTHRISEIVDRWYEGGVHSGEPCQDYFKVRTEDGKQYILKYNRLFDAWAVMIRE